MLIESIKKKQKTILLTTHYMEEAHTLCDEIAIMNKGKIIAQGDPDVLLRNHFQGALVEIPSEPKPQKSVRVWNLWEHVRPRAMDYSNR